MRSNSMRGELSLDKILKYPGAREAFDKLVRAKVEPRNIESGLQFVVESEQRLRAARDRRGASNLARRTRALAGDIESARKSSLGFTVRARLTDEEMDTLLALLGAYAGTWEDTLSWRAPRDASPRTEAVVQVLEMIEWSTDRYHYDEMAALLNAADWAHSQDRAIASRHLPWDAANLKQLMHRAKKRLGRTGEA